MAAAGEATQLTPDDWDQAIDVNLRGAVNGVLAVYPAMVEAGQGWIVNVASLAGLVPVPLLVPYAMTKQGLVGLSTSLRLEAARHGVRVSVACPGPVETPLLDTPGIAVDVRRYLTAAGGPPMRPDAFAAAVLRGMATDRAVIAPRRAGVIWSLARHAPRLASRVIASNLERELRPTTSPG